MAITPFVEAPTVRTVPQPVSGGIDTSAYDQFRQGVSIRTAREQFSGMFPKMMPAEQLTPNGEDNSTLFGVPKAFKSNVPYRDLQKFDAVKFIKDDFRTQIYPQIMRNSSLTDPYQLDGAIEPLTIREAVSMMSIEGSNQAHAIRGNLCEGNLDERSKTSQVVQIYDYRAPLKTKPFIDFPEYMGASAMTAVSRPGVISMVETTRRPFVDMPFAHRIFHYAPNVNSDSGWREWLPYEQTSGSFDVMLGAHEVSATAGFVYENNPLGTDSLAFGGWKK